jgi:hypothetical protein
MELTRQQKRILREGIVNAYPSSADLIMMLSEEMDIDYEAITRGNTYASQVFNLIQQLEAEGRLEAFIKVIIKDKPRSPYLQKIAAEFPFLGLSQDQLESLYVKLSYLQERASKTSDPALKFQLVQQIQELQKEINELGGELPADSLAVEEKIDRKLLRVILNNLITQQFNGLMYDLNPPKEVILPYTASQSDRVIELLRWAESPSGIGLMAIQQALEDILNPPEDRASVENLSSKFDSKLMEQSQQFLRQAGAAIASEGKWIQVTSISLPKLVPYLPFLVTFSNQFNKLDIDELYNQAKQTSSSQNFKVALIFYEEQPDMATKLQIAQVRLENFIIIPISFSSIQNALLSPTSAVASSGILVDQTQRYLPGADMFNDKNAIGDTLSFYGRIDLLQQLQEELIRYQGIGLLGIRKSGKTSILLQLQFTLRDYPVVYLDLQPYGGKNYYGNEIFNQILKRLFSLLRRQDDPSVADFMLNTNAPAKQWAGKFAESITFLNGQLIRAKFKTPIICFFDELERIFPTPNDSPERIEEFNTFFGTLRQLSQQDKSLAFLIADVHPDFNRTNHWYNTNLPTNPVYQFFKEIYVPPFAEEETATMLRELGLLMGVRFEQELFHIIHTMSGGHPFISRQIASALNRKIDNATPETGNYITLTLGQTLLDKILPESNDIRNYFKENIWGDMQKKNFICAITILSILACNNLEEGVNETQLLEKLSEHFNANECDESLAFLRDTGLIISKGQNYCIKIQLMAQWITRNLTKKEKLQWQICSETTN